jgi:hypothetical protein
MACNTSKYHVFIQAIYVPVKATICSGLLLREVSFDAEIPEFH